MAYFDNLLEASWISPQGKEFKFSYDVLSRETSHRIGNFEFSGVDGTLHQDKGVSGAKFPMEIYLHGPDYDGIADQFFSASLEKGPSVLNHPRWGRLRVQLLSISQVEKTVSEAGQAVFSVVYQETLDREFPKTGASPQYVYDNHVNNFKETVKQAFVNRVNTDSLPDQKALESEMVSSAQAVETDLGFLASTSQDIATEFKKNLDDIVSNAANYVDEPVEYANRIVDAVTSVSKSGASIANKLIGYNNILSSIPDQILSLADVPTRNLLLINELIGTSALVGSSASVNIALNATDTIARDQNGVATIISDQGGFKNRAEVMTAVTFLESKSEEITGALDDGQELFLDKILDENYIQVVDSYVPTWETVGIVIKAGLDLSFSLPVKVSKKITNARTILDLCYEFYGNIEDSTLDYFIKTNALTGRSIVLVPAGSTVVYYE